MNFTILKEKYPVGKILEENHFLKHHTSFYYTHSDQDFFYRNYVNVVFLPNHVCEYDEIVHKQMKVEGWIFDGSEWWPAYDTWDGWVPYTEEELKKFEKN